MLGNIGKGHVAIPQKRQVRNGLLAQFAIVHVGLEPVAFAPSIVNGIGLVRGKVLGGGKVQLLELWKDNLGKDLRQGIFRCVDPSIPEVAVDAPAFSNIFSIESGWFPGRKDSSINVDTSASSSSVMKFS